MAMADEAEEVRTRRRINPVFLVGGGVLVLAILVFFVIMPLFSGDDEGNPEVPAAVAPAASAPSPAAAPADQPPAETFEVFESKDPFRPLVTEQATEGAAPGTAPGSNGTGTTNGTGAGGAPAPSGGQRVSLLDVLDEGGTAKAQVKVGSTVYTVASGEVFADNFKVVSISGSCVTLLHGDDKFTLCEGEEVIK
jgi:hypothetical protein